MFKYYYFGLNKLWVMNLTDSLEKIGHSEISFESGGSRAVTLQLKVLGSKALTAGILLTKDEYESIPNLSSLPTTARDKLHSFSTEEELRSFIEGEHELSLSAPVEVEPEVSVGVSEPAPTVVEPVRPVVEPVREVVEPIRNVPVVKTLVKPVVEPVSEVTRISEPVPSEPTLSDLAYQTVFEERNALEVELDSLRLEYEKLKCEKGSSAEVGVLKGKVVDLETALGKAEGLVKTYKDNLEAKNTRISDLKNYSNELQDTINAQKARIIELEASSASMGISEVAHRELPRIEVPYQINFCVAASAFSLAGTYQHLISNSKNTVIVDLCRESVMDTLVKFGKQMRITKWLLEGMNVRAVYSPFEQLRLIPAEGLTLVSSPNTVLADTILSDIDWERKIKELAQLDRPVTIFLGLEDANGVSELIDRLNKPVKVYRADNPLEARSWSRIHYKHEDSVEEVIL